METAVLTGRSLVAAARAALVIGALLIVGCTPASQSTLAASVEGLHKTNGSAPAIAGDYALLRTRGSAVDAEIPLPPPGQAIELRVLPEFAARPARYRVRLFRMSADDSLQSVAELGGLAPDADNFVTVFVDGARLQPQTEHLVFPATGCCNNQVNSIFEAAL